MSLSLGILGLTALSPTVIFQDVLVKRSNPGPIVTCQFCGSAWMLRVAWVDESVHRIGRNFGGVGAEADMPD